jgi:hypothetical protein
MTSILHRILIGTRLATRNQANAGGTVDIISNVIHIAYDNKAV